MLRSTELEARRHKHELTHDYTENLPLIMGDRGRIEQVMLNVLSNAVKYTPDGGHIRVTAGSEGETVWMEVADDGIGIPEADRQPHFRALLPRRQSKIARSAAQARPFHRDGDRPASPRLAHAR